MPRSIDRAALLVRRDHTLGNVMDRLERVHGDRTLVTEEGDGLALTYAQAAKRVRRWAGGIAAQTTPGDVVVVATPNGTSSCSCASPRRGPARCPPRSTPRCGARRSTTWWPTPGRRS